MTTDPATAKAVSDIAGKIEQLLVNLGSPLALLHAVAVREVAATVIPEWSNASFNNERLLIDRLLQQGQLLTAHTRAQTLLEQVITVGSTAYHGADYDFAMAHDLLAQTLKAIGQTATALGLWVEAQQLFEELGKSGQLMVSVTMMAQADCLRELGRLKEAATTYEAAIDQSEKLASFRQVAVGKTQLATVRLLQKKYTEALNSYETALAIFEAQNESGSVATIWHQLGIVQQGMEQYEAAEAAYRRSLEIRVTHNMRGDQAGSLTMLGNLYDDHLQRSEEAIAFYRQAAAIYVELGDIRCEGVARNNIAVTLYKLKHYNQARAAVLQAIECIRQFGHTAEPWKTFNILHRIENATGNSVAARAAWKQARDTYLTYRRQGGYAQQGNGNLVEHVIGLLMKQKVTDVEALFVQLLNARGDSDSRKQLVRAMTAIFSGSRDTSLADDLALTYADAAEILFLIERLGA